MIAIVTTYYSVLFIVGVHIVDSLECYTCSNISNVVDCTITSRCQNDQSCFLNVSSNGSRLGCINNQECGGRLNVASLIGRSLHLSQDLENEQSSHPYLETRLQELRAILSERDVNTCFECCSSDICNDNLCKHLKPTACIDDPKVDCALINSKFGICLNIHEAKTMCPKFCGLCSLVDGNWESWSSWSTCDVTCANGTQIRTRLCTNPSPVSGGLDCIGKGNETRVCSLSPCPIDGSWTEWSSWSACNVTCETGIQTRTRTCSNPSPAYNGRNCSGDTIDTTVCTNNPCPVHGGWTEWFSWGPCSVTCDFGIQRRFRNCSNPVPQRFGDHCFGSNMDDTICQLGPCANGNWSQWNAWSSCSATCGDGIKSRSRLCNNPRPSVLGRECEGDALEYLPCNNEACLTPSVAFSSRDVRNLSLLSPRTLVFTTTILNEGNGYNNSTGIFTAPIAGVYYIDSQLCLPSGGRNFIFYAVVLNRDYIKRGYIDNNNINSGDCESFSTVALLHKGYTVHIENTRGTGYLIDSGEAWNSFSGYLLYM